MLFHEVISQLSEMEVTIGFELFESFGELSEDPPPPQETIKNNKRNKIFLLKWCGTPVSNRRPSAWQADALPTELVPHWWINILL